MWENYIIKLQRLYAAVFSFHVKNCSFYAISPLFSLFDRIQPHWRTRKGGSGNLKPETGNWKPETGNLITCRAVAR